MLHDPCPTCKGDGWIETYIDNKTTHETECPTCQGWGVQGPPYDDDEEEEWEEEGNDGTGIL